MFKRGLAYRKKAEVNWCVKCLTVLADEQVIDEKCERCGSAVVKKELEQWFFKITHYAERLLKNLDGLDWPEKVKIAQRNWIGKSEGVLIPFQMANFKTSDALGTSDVHNIEVFTTRPDTIKGVSFIALAPTHPLAKNKDIVVLHPITQKELPVFVADYVMSDYGTGAIMGVPAHDERDRAFAKHHGIAVIDAPLISVDEAIQKSGGKKETRYRLRDWLISRQRYWGPPIPMIFCEHCAWQPVPEKDLPVILPRVKNFKPTGTGQSPLASVKSFYETQCPACGGAARRETDVSDTFLDSSWYYLSYLMIHDSKFMNPESPFSKQQFKKWLPVAMYIGGAEHSVLHLLYARFIAMALHDMQLINFEEPFTVFRAHGLLIKEGAKMSKSKGNTVNPDAYIARFGADTLRLYLLFCAPFLQGGDFRDQAVLGAHRFLNRVWKGISDVGLRKTIGLAKTPRVNKKTSDTKELEKILHQTIKKVTEDINALHYNTAISALMIALRALENFRTSDVHKTDGFAQTKIFKTFLQLLAPFAPHITEELWHVLGEKQSIHLSSWPQYDETLLREESFNLVVQVNGKTRAIVSAPPGINQKDAEQRARKNARVRNGIANKKITRVIFVPDRLINFIVA